MKKNMILAMTLVVLTIIIGIIFFCAKPLNKPKPDYYKNILISNNRQLNKKHLHFSEIKNNIGVYPLAFLDGYRQSLDAYKKEISFLRETKNFYYAVFESEGNMFYLFFNKESLSLEASFFLSKNINKESLMNAQSFYDVCKIDATTIIKKDNDGFFSSVHVLSDGSQIVFKYLKNGDDYYIHDKYVNVRALKNCIDEIFSCDSPN